MSVMFPKDFFLFKPCVCVICRIWSNYLCGNETERAKNEPKRMKHRTEECVENETLHVEN